MKKKVRVSKSQAIALISVAIIFDLLQFLLTFVPVVDFIAGLILGFFAWILFGVWLYIGLGVKVMDGKQAIAKATTVLAGVCVELIPFLDALPALTLSITVSIILSWMEDTGVNVLNVKSAKLMLETAGKMTADAVIKHKIDTKRFGEYVAKQAEERKQLEQREDIQQGARDLRKRIEERAEKNGGVNDWFGGPIPFEHELPLANGLDAGGNYRPQNPETRVNKGAAGSVREPA